MKLGNINRLLLGALVVGALTACTAIQPPASTPSTPAADTATATPMPSEEATTVPDRSAVAPVDTAECEAISAAIAAELAVEMEVAEGELTSEIGGWHGTACTITATGTGEDFGNFVDTAQTIRDVLVSQGWTENPTYLADGPTGTASGYELDNKMALVSVEWQPGPAVSCMADRPISECNVPPDQQIFTVGIQLFQTS